MHHGRYDLARQTDAIARYNTAMDGFYAREKMDVKGHWTRHSARRVSGPDSLSGRHVLMSALRKLGFFRAEG